MQLPATCALAGGPAFPLFISLQYCKEYGTLSLSEIYHSIAVAAIQANGLGGHLLLPDLLLLLGANLLRLLLDTNGDESDNNDTSRVAPARQWTRTIRYPLPTSA